MSNKLGLTWWERCIYLVVQWKPTILILCALTLAANATVGGAVGLAFLGLQLAHLLAVVCAHAGWKEGFDECAKIDDRWRR